MRLPFHIDSSGKLTANPLNWADMIERMRQQIMAAEDEAIFAALDSAAKDSK